MDDFPDLPPELIWNMDEKGLQLGVGRKNSRRRFYTLNALKAKSCYRICPDNLELVTVVERISAAGVVMPPAFVLSDSQKPDITDLNPSDIARSVLSC